jgi:YbbR domain-containing protein
VWQVVRKNFGLKVLSLGIAILAWAYVRFAGNPVIAARFDQELSVPITVSGLSEDYTAQLSEKQAIVTIASPRNGTIVSPANVRAVVNLADHPAGVYTVPIEIIAPDLEVKAARPTTATVVVAHR